jgi:hypothetical protein
MSDTSFYDVKMYVLTKATTEEISSLYDYARARINELGTINARQFNVGDAVMFEGGHGRGMIHGTFVRRLQKNAIVKDRMGMEWRVGPNLLEKDLDSLTGALPVVKITRIP